MTDYARGCASGVAGESAGAFTTTVTRYATGRRSVLLQSELDNGLIVV